MNDSGNVDGRDFVPLSQYFSLLLEPFEQMIADPQSVGHCGQSWIHRTDAREKTRVHDVKVVEFVRLAIYIEHRALRVLAKAAGAGLMRDAANPDLILHI